MSRVGAFVETSQKRDHRQELASDGVESSLMAAGAVPVWRWTAVVLDGGGNLHVVRLLPLSVECGHAPAIEWI